MVDLSTYADRAAAKSGSGGSQSDNGLRLRKKDTKKSGKETVVKSGAGERPEAEETSLADAKGPVVGHRWWRSSGGGSTE